MTLSAEDQSEWDGDREGLWNLVRFGGAFQFDDMRIPHAGQAALVCKVWSTLLSRL